VKQGEPQAEARRQGATLLNSR